jgi:hypothetical protein
LRDRPSLFFAFGGGAACRDVWGGQKKKSVFQTPTNLFFGLGKVACRPALRNIHLWIKTGTTPTQKGQEMDYPFRKSSIFCCSVIKFLEPQVSQFWAMKETNIKNLCCSQTIKYFRAAQKSLLLFCAAHRNKQKYFDTFASLWDDTKRSNCPGRVGFA